MSDAPPPKSAGTDALAFAVAQMIDAGLLDQHLFALRFHVHQRSAHLASLERRRTHE